LNLDNYEQKAVLRQLQELAKNVRQIKIKVDNIKKKLEKPKTKRNKWKLIEIR